ncbi:MAG: AmmeMemoRadiSam system protein B [Myxococcales bacterium]|nr:AmmeMemoRadiSam system protein B [Myxococcales bacterium]
MKRLLTCLLPILLTWTLWVGCDPRPQANDTPMPTPLPGKTYENGEAKMQFRPVVAGQFYPGGQEQLRQDVDSYLQNAVVPADLGDIFGIVAPHAGYVYSGPVAGHSYRAVQGKKYDFVVVLGLSHRVPGEVALLHYDSYLTPLGAVTIDRAATEQLAKAAPFIDRSDEMFRYEHSLEVQLPFIQRALPQTPVVLIAIGSARQDTLRQLAAALDKTFADRHVLYVASTDLSHFRTYDQAVKIDTQSLDFLARHDLEGLYKAPELRERMCGLGPVTVLFELFKRRGGKEARLLKYLNSGDTSGDKSRVVGYGSLALLAQGMKTMVKTEETKPAADAGGAEDYLSADDKKELLQLARRTIEAYVKNGKTVEFQPTSDALKKNGAAFVTLTKKADHQLRGCIGQIIATIPLWECVRDMAIAAATQDPRFSAVREREIQGLRIEISVLTPPVRIKDISEIQVGVHGLIMSKGWNRGLLLPQVPTEYGWDRNTFLDQTCRKAGMNAGCWRDPDTKIERFAAIVFSETE